MKRALVLLGLLLLTGPAGAAEKFKEATLPPVHEEGKDKEFAAYLTKLKAAVGEKDRAKLLPLLSKQIKSSFGAEEDSLAAFRKEWKLNEQPQKSRLWQELARVLAEGITREADGSFNAPYYFSRWPNDFSAYETSLIYGENVPVLAQARAGAPLVRKASYLIVKTEFSEEPWRKVQLPSGKEGFVEGKYLRSPIGYRAIFAQKNKEWQMTHFIAGD